MTKKVNSVIIYQPFYCDQISWTGLFPRLLRDPLLSEHEDLVNSTNHVKISPQHMHIYFSLKRRNLERSSTLA